MDDNIKSFDISWDELDKISTITANHRLTTILDTEKISKIASAVKTPKPSMISVYEKSSKPDHISNIISDITMDEMVEILTNLAIVSKKNDDTLAKFSSLVKSMRAMNNPACVIAVRTSS